jgi:hypothetical protein
MSLSRPESLGEVSEEPLSAELAGVDEGDREIAGARVSANVAGFYFE